MTIYYSGTNDAGFSCSWNHSSEKVAVGSQDGLVSVWDIRYITGSNNSSMLPTPVSPMNRAFSQSTVANQHLQKDPTKLACIPTTQHPQVKGACRSVKFSPSPSIDLLMFTEHVNYVNFVDSRTFDSKQSIRVSPVGTDLHLSGAAWTPDSRGVFVGMCYLRLNLDI
jgi:WD40 repeat protein